MRGRLAIAAAVLVGGGAAGVVAVATSHSSTVTAASAQTDGYSTKYHQTLSDPWALTQAFSNWGKSSYWSNWSLNTLANMAPMRTFNQWNYQRTTIAEQRGVVLLATKKFLIVKSADGDIRLWWLTGGTQFKDVGSSSTGMVAMTGSDLAAWDAMTNGNMAPAEDVMTGSTSTVTQLTSLVTMSNAMSINTGGQIVTVSVTKSLATVTTTTMTTTTTVTRSVQPTFQRTWGVERGDLVLIIGTRTNGQLKAKIVLFAAPLNVMPTPIPWPTSITSTPTAFPTAFPTPTSTMPTFSGTSS
jgi:hypothetical protein